MLISSSVGSFVGEGDGSNNVALQKSSSDIAGSDAGARNFKTSLQVFRKFIKRRSDGSLDASQVHSLDCYEAWLQSRRNAPSEPEKSFQRCLSSHLTAVDGLSPFTKAEEQAILVILRQKTRWPCFAHCKTRFGHAGFRALGYFEKQAHDMDAAAAQPLSIGEPATMKRANTPESSATNSCSPMEARYGDNKFVRLDLEESHRKRSNSDAFELSVFEDLQNHSDLNIAQTLFSSSLGIVSRLSSSIATDFIKHGMDIFRSFMVVTGYFRPYSDVDLRRLFDEFVQKYPTDIVLVIDSAASSFANRFVLQNDTSKTILGPITAGEGGCSRSLVCEDDSRLISGIMFDCIKCRGRKEADITMRLLCLDNTKVYFDMAFYMDADTSLVAMHGRPRYDDLLRD